MSRLPFDPGKAHGGSGGESRRPARRERTSFKQLTEAEYLTVTQLAHLIKSTLEQRIASPIRVIGQVSNLTAQDHWYFSLKDESAVVQCVAWASSARKFGFTPEDGDEVIATGHVSHYPPQGRTQLYVSQLKPLGAGALQLRFEAMCEELRALGYFDEAHKRPPPVFPRRIAVITSAAGAAVHDVISTAAHRCNAVGLLIVDVRVQGEGAAEDVARAVRWVDANHDQLGVDAILVTRGGGSIEDLWAFNERVVADAAYECGVPIVAAIGHESDTTVIELVADLRAATPTQAAMRLVPDKAELHQQVSHLADRLTLLTRLRLDWGRERLRLLADREAFRRPEAIVLRARERLESAQRQLAGALRHGVAGQRSLVETLAARLAQLQPTVLVSRRHERLAVLADRLHRGARRRIDQWPTLHILRRSVHAAAQRRLDQCRQRLAALDRELTAVDPRLVLGRGYTLTAAADGRLVRFVRDVSAGQIITTHVQDGTIDSTVAGSARRRRIRSKRRPAADEPGQMDLFDQSQ